MEKQTRLQHNVLCFRRWSRKAYAAYNSIGKHVRIGVLSLTCSILSVPAISKENRDSLDIPQPDRELTLQEVVISAQRGPVLQSELMRVVQVISRAEIEQAPVADLASLLEHARGLDIRKRGSFGMQADVSVRGGTFDQVLILLNGINITDPQTGHHNLNVPVSLQSIERIEVLQGPGARLFGPNAFSGAINIITRQPVNNHLGLSIEAGQYAFGSAAVQAGFTTFKLSHFVDLNMQRSDGFAKNTDFKNFNLYYRTQFTNSSFVVDAQVALSNKAFGANSFYTPRFPDQFEETDTRLVSLQFLPKGKINLKSSLYWRRHYDRFELFRHEAPEWYAGHNYHMSDVTGATTSWLHTSRLGKSSLGLDTRCEQIYSTVLGNALEKVRPAYQYEGVDYTHFYRRWGLGLMGEHSYYAGRFSVSAGMLVYFNPELEKNVSLFPGIDAAMQLNDQIRWFSSFGRTLRLPTFTDLFYSSPTNLGNAMLQPERAVSAETGFKATWLGLDLDAVFFRRWGKNMIDWIKEPGDQVWKSMNLTEVNFSGFEAAATIPFPVKYLFSGAAVLSLQYTFLHADKSSGTYISNYVLDYARHKAAGNVTLPIGQWAGVTFNFSWVDRAGGYLLYEDGAYAGLKDFSPHALFDSRLFFRWGKMEWYAEAQNLLNTEVVSIANVPQPGRWIRLGVKMETGM